MYKTVRGSKTRGQTFKGRGETFNRKLRGTIFTLSGGYMERVTKGSS